MKTESELQKEVKRRNYYLERFFASNGFDISLMGDYNNPLIVTEQNIVLSCYVHNFELICKDDHHSGEVLLRVKLKFHVETNFKKELKKWYKEAKHRKVYLFKSGDFLFSKFTMLEEKEYHLYTKSKRVAYYVFSRQKAIEVKNKLSKNDEKVEIIY